MLRENTRAKVFWEHCVDSSAVCMILFESTQLLYAVKLSYAFHMKS